MFCYRISIQFADPAAPDFDESIMSVLERAVTHYNIKSRIAKNPKQIIKKQLIDSRTFELILQSESKLPLPSKALRLFSAYLVDPSTDGALNQYIYGKQLFKMSSEQISEESENKVESNTEINALRIRAIGLLLNAPEDAVSKVLDILKEDRNADE